MTPYEALYGRKCQSPLCWYEGENRAILGSQLVDETTEKMKFMRNYAQFKINRKSIMILDIRK
ncbi:hypothetical protein AXF42_Ash016926 [Apostasia shenzhenica]|uniref:Uncharacterized protein n=1 Tax=Apostasia shenzhenica TaxID=1088818 RepID=A0A2H9ZRI1_9ASPA|nr:hypothetical protein AXF42_Ash016926 [Apostasia shenzhenica]